MTELEPASAADTHGQVELVATPVLDLDLIERDLRDVESTLARLADGTYFAQPGASVPSTDAPGSSAGPISVSD